jgi:hypothetical protein
VNPEANYMRLRVVAEGKFKTKLHEKMHIGSLAENARIAKIAITKTTKVIHFMRIICLKIRNWGATLSATPDMIVATLRRAPHSVGMFVAIIKELNYPN